MVDFIISRMNDFQRLSDREPGNYTALESVRFCSDLLYRFGVAFVRRDGKDWEIIK